MNNNNVLVVGNFDILHPGHIRLLKFAKECGNNLIVAINSDDVCHENCNVNEEHRLEMVKSLECVDDAFITSKNSFQLVTELKPWAVVKGKEFESEGNAEQAILESYGGRLIFGSGTFESGSEQFFNSEHQIGKSFNFTGIKKYCHRRKITRESLTDIFENIKKLKVAVIGEVIVDEYVQGSAMGLSQEDPTIVMSSNHTKLFLGGAAITAGHMSSLGANKVTLFSVLGSDEQAQYVKKNISSYNIESFFVEDPSRPTPLKTRYRVENKTLLRVNKVRQHKIIKKIQDELLAQISKSIENIDVLVFSDFNYGVLPQKLVDKIIKLCFEHNVKLVADSQSSSQIGDVSRYKNMFLMTPTEREVRLALNNFDDGLVTLSKKLCEKSLTENLVITLGAEGVFIHLPDPENNTWENEKIAAVNKIATDPAGAGDCFLATSTLSLMAGSTPWQAFYLASIAAACQVDRVGNTPLEYSVLMNNIERSFI